MFSHGALLKMKLQVVKEKLLNEVKSPKTSSKVDCILFSNQRFVTAKLKKPKDLGLCSISHRIKKFIEKSISVN